VSSVSQEEIGEKLGISHQTVGRSLCPKMESSPKLDSLTTFNSTTSGASTMLLISRNRRQTWYQRLDSRGKGVGKWKTFQNPTA
jgi:hypothetical protein